ncbi:MAG TPA: RluA family pseudouridine synthase [Pyrinomonadaceae bacterium]|nr:RluA family pseudouridine synthase [Pyrinomonadaceae bacterium]
MEQLLEFHVGEAQRDERLDRFLASQLGWLSRMRINSLLLQGACRVNSETAAPGRHLQTGDRVEITLDENGPTAMTPEEIPLDIVYEDAHLLVINKTAGMLVHPTRKERSGTLSNALAFHLNRAMLEEQGASTVRPGLVHRLDRATSGLMVVAKTPRSLSILTRHFHRRLIEKRYLALVHGRIEEDELTIEAPIGRDPSAHPKWNVSAGGKPSETRLRVVERRANATLVELVPVTGRTNQLRIHCAHVGHAIMGDDWYAEDTVPRLCLHAAQLCFHHPSGGDWLEFTSQLPAEFLQLLNESSPS